MAQRKQSDRIAEALREDGPHLDEVTRARMERRLLDSLRLGDAAAPDLEQARRRVRTRRTLSVALAGVLAAAAAIALAFHGRSDGAQVELRASGTTHEQEMTQGATVHTAEGETADVRFDHVHVHVAQASTVRLSRLSPGDIVLDLDRGSVLVEFHPERRGEEHLAVSTDAARVEVVGTVFEVRTDGTSTAVDVREGVVRVVPRRDGDVRLVHAGERWASEVAHAEARPVEAAQPPPQPSVPTEPVVTPSTPPSQPRPAPHVSDDDRFAAAEAMLERGDREGAREILAALTTEAHRARDRARAHTLVGDSWLRDGDFERAATAYEHAIEAGQGSLEALNALYALAMLRERRIGDFERARQDYRRYLDIAPEGPHAGLSRHALCRLGDASMCP